MCARYEINAPPEDLAEVFALGAEAAAAAAKVEPRWNAAPTQMLPVVRADETGARRIDLLRWGLVPSWAEDLKIGHRMINARAETVAGKPSFRSALNRRRCLVPATGFYEWTGEPGSKQAWIFRRADRRPFAFAGLWETWRASEKDEPVVTFTILTTTPNDVVRPVHDRMPVIVDPADFAVWLGGPDVPAARLESLLVPAPAASWTTTAVGPAVNNPRNEGPDCAAPASRREDG